MKDIAWNRSPGYPEIIRLAERLGVEPFEGHGAIVIACGENNSGPKYSLEALLHATLDRLDAATQT